MALQPGSRAMITDVCVPVSRLAECILQTRADIESSGVIAPIVGHVGDGNFHVLILLDPGNSAEIDRAAAVNDRLVTRALALGGTCTGEHGVGCGKIDYLAREHGAGIEVMRTIKQALDPQDLMNPGKLFSSGADRLDARA
jgi:D-lactate dehydrogenase (cytochrome)